MRWTAYCVIALLLLLDGCGGKKKPLKAIARPIGWSESGVASWYGHPYHGRQAANGETYDMEKMTAAHLTLPFGAWVRVKNVDNSRTVEVRITDRGPFVKGRIIDLSRVAAAALQMIGPGTAKVRLEVIRPPKETIPVEVAKRGSGAWFAVQVGAFEDRQSAERIRGNMAARHGSATLVPREGRRTLWRVLVGREPSEEDAAALAERIVREGDGSNGFVVRLDP